VDAPKRVSGDLFNALVEEWLATHAVQVGVDGATAPTEDSNPLYACITCGTPIEWRRAYMSIHEDGWTNCAGYGECTNPTIPVCPACEPNPVVFGCIHEGGPAPVVPTTPWPFRAFAWLIKLFS